MSGTTVWVPPDIFRKADTLIRGVSGQAIKEGIELLLKSDLTVGGENPGPGLGRVDASNLLVRGLASLQNNPHEALGLPVGAKTQEIRKAYKRAALQYHPDKNPKTTPLFQAIQLACDKLSDREERAKAEKAANATASQNQYTSVPTAPVSRSHAHQQQPSQQHFPYSHKREVKDPYPQPPRHQEPPSQPKRDSGYERYRSAASYESAYGAAPQAHSQQDYRQRHNEAAEDLKRRANAAEAATKFESDLTAKEAAHKRAADSRAAAMREAAAQKQRDREEVLKAGYYFEEQAKLRLEKLEKERAAAEAAIASRRAMYGNVASATPDSSQLPINSQFKNLNSDASNLRGYGQNNSRVGSKAVPKPLNTSAAAESGIRLPLNDPQPVRGVPTVAADRKLHAQPASSSKPQPQQPAKQRKHLVPVPIDFCYIAISESTVELEWKISAVAGTPVLIQLSWRKQIVTASWQSATRLINGTKCRKNNLELACLGGSIYEFRIRAIEDLPGGMLGDRSEWTDNLLVLTYTSKQPQIPPTKLKSEKRKTPPVLPGSASIPTVPPTQHNHIFEKPDQYRNNTKAAGENLDSQPISGTIPGPVPKSESSGSSSSSRSGVPVSHSAAPMPPPLLVPPKIVSSQYPSYIHKELKYDTENTTVPLPPPIAPPKVSEQSHKKPAVPVIPPLRPNSAVTQPPERTSEDPGPAGRGVRRHSEEKIMTGVKEAGDLDGIAQRVRKVDLNNCDNSEHSVDDDDVISDDTHTPKWQLPGKESVLVPPFGTLNPDSRMTSSSMSKSFTRRAWERENEKSLSKDSTDLGPPSEDYSEDIEEEEESLLKSTCDSTGSDSYSDAEQADEAIFDEEKAGNLGLGGRLLRKKSSKYLSEMVCPAEKVVSEKKKQSPKLRVRIAKKGSKKDKINLHPHSVAGAGSGSEVTGECKGKNKSADGLQKLWYELLAPEGLEEYEHPVRNEPLQGAEIVGYLVSGRSVLAQAVVGSWARVNYHKTALPTSLGGGHVGGKAVRFDGCGWCTLIDVKTKHLFLVSYDVEDEIEDEEEDAVAVPNSRGVPIIDTKTGGGGKPPEPKISYAIREGKKISSAPGKSDGKIEEWHERYDEEGGYSYNFNMASGVSSWETPEWVEEVDPVSKTKYYVQLNVADGTPLMSTWTKPAVYARIIRRTQP